MWFCKQLTWTHFISTSELQYSLCCAALTREYSIKYIRVCVYSTTKCGEKSSRGNATTRHCALDTVPQKAEHFYISVRERRMSRTVLCFLLIFLYRRIYKETQVVLSLCVGIDKPLRNESYVRTFSTFSSKHVCKPPCFLDACVCISMGPVALGCPLTLPVMVHAGSA